MSFRQTFRKHATGFAGAYALCMAVLGTGWGIDQYSIKVSGDTPGERIPLCHAKYKACETSISELNSCLNELSHERQSTRLNASIILMFGFAALMVVTGVHGVSLLSKNQPPPPEP